MTRIYLDTSNMSRLARAASIEPVAFRAFVQDWKSRACTLVLSFPHIVEMGRASEPARAERYKLVEALLPCTTDLPFGGADGLPSVQLREREVVRALVERGRIRIENASVEWLRFNTEIFVASYEDQASIAALRVLDDPKITAILEAAYAAIELEAQARRRAEGTRPIDPRVENVPDKRLTEAEIGDYTRKIEDAVRAVDIGAVFMNVVQPDVLQAELDKQLDRIRNLLRRAGEVGYRRAWLEFLELDEARDRIKRVGQATTQSMFLYHARAAMSGILGIKEGELVDALAHAVSLADCPGYWLSAMVQSEIRSAESDPAPSNTYDLLHVQYYPYVDLFFTDKRIAGYINRVRARNQNARISGLRPALAVPDTLEAIQCALRTLDERLA